MIRLNSKQTGFIITIFCIIIIIISMTYCIMKINMETEIRQQRQDILYIKDGYDTRIVLSLKDVRRKISSFTALIINRYSKRYHPKKPMAMNKYEKDQFIRDNIKYSELLGYGYYDLIALSLMESRFNPYAVGQLLDERSMWQLTRWAVPEACYYFKLLPDEIKPIMSFCVTDLSNVANVHKIVAVYWWGLKKEYLNQMDWVVTFFHWGKSFIHKYYKIGKFPGVFVFNKGKAKESKRPVKAYFNTWYNIVNSFNSGRIEIEEELNYWEDNRKKMILPEIKLIDSYKHIKRLKIRLAEVEKIQSDYFDGMNKYYNKIKKEVQKTDKKYKIIFKGVKSGEFGKFKKISMYMLQSKNFFKEFRDEVYKEDQWQFWLIFSLILGLFFIMLTILIIIVLKVYTKIK